MALIQLYLFNKNGNLEIIHMVLKNAEYKVILRHGTPCQNQWGMRRY